MTTIKQTDRDAAESLAEACEADWLVGRYFGTTTATAFARHREQAKAETVAGIVAYLVKGRAGIIAAKIKAGEWKK